MLRVGMPSATLGVGSDCARVDDTRDAERPDGVPTRERRNKDAAFASNWL